MTSMNKPPPQMKIRDRDAIEDEYSLQLPHFQMLAAQLNGKSMYRSCLNCLFFDETTEQCKKYKLRPPARVIWQGCEDHKDAFEIPF